MLGHQETVLALIPALPLLGAVVCGLFAFFPLRSRSIVGWCATFFAVLSFLLSAFLYQHHFLASAQDSAPIKVFLYSWINAGPFHAHAALTLDALSQVMILVISGVGSIIHMYAIGYMAEDESKPRFFACLNLFLFFMLTLVLADNLLLMFVGWEGVGLCSYLLIGFWYGKMDNARAGQKAFVVNRIGDAGFLLGMFLLFREVGGVEFSEIIRHVPEISPWLLEVIAALLLLGAIGKSAQIPLFVWLPDAMAGPTPVSALIHAATMVTAGVYLITRLAPLYQAAPQVEMFILILGALTACYAAMVAAAQYDIKKMLAYSTISQLGYMFMALGAGAFSYAVFHLITHAFFKALLFMAAGSVIVSCHHEQDMRRFGGLWNKTSVAFLAYLFGAYALAGLPFGSGSYSKEGILWAVYQNQGFNSPVAVGAWGIGLFTAFLTAFYVTRSLVLTFFGRYRGEQVPHEGSFSMQAAMAFLIAPSLFFGYLYGERCLEFLKAWARADLLSGHAALESNAAYVRLNHLTMMVAAAGSLSFLFLYLFGQKLVGQFKNRVPESCNPLLNQCWVNEICQYLIVRPLRGIAGVVFSLFDRIIIDGTAEGSAMAVLGTARMISMLHLGRVRCYLLFMFCSALTGIVFWMLL